MNYSSNINNMSKFFLTISLLVVGWASCSSGSQSRKDEPTQAYEKTDSCTSNAQNSYEVYVPARTSRAEKLPLLIILDSHGGGKFALQKFKQAADKYGVALAASNLVKNGYPNYEQAIQSLLEDVRTKYPVNETIYLTGFSGGARMALGYASNHAANGLLLCGALGSPQQIGALSCPVVSVSGTDDFNFVETAQYLFQAAAMPQNLKIELTEQSHSWPSNEMLTNAFAYIVLAGKPIDDTQVADFQKTQQIRIDSLLQQRNWIKAELVSQNMTESATFDPNKHFSATCDSLKSSEGFTSQMQLLGQSLNTEMNLRQTYLNAFSTQDEAWWKKEIASVDEKTKNASDNFTKDMYLRIKGFWGIVCYSYCKQAAAQRNEALLSKILLVYKAVEPQNPDMFYFSAFIPMWKGNEASAVDLLKKALSLGFSDLGEMKKNFPETIVSQIHS